MSEMFAKNVYLESEHEGKELSKFRYGVLYETADLKNCYANVEKDLRSHEDSSRLKKSRGT